MRLTNGDISDDECRGMVASEAFFYVRGMDRCLLSPCGGEMKRGSAKYINCSGRTRLREYFATVDGTLVAVFLVVMALDMIAIGAQ